MLARFPETQRFITESAAVLQEPQTRNFQTWDILNTYVWPNRVVTGSYAGEIRYLSEWLNERTTWVSQQLQQPQPWSP